MKRFVMWMMGAALALALIGCNSDTPEANGLGQGSKTPPGQGVNGSGEGGETKVPQ